MIPRPDRLGIALLAGLAAALIGGGVVLIEAEIVQAWELLGVLAFGAVMVAAARPQIAPQRPPPTRDAWDGGFQDMDSANHRMAKKDH